jgi:hypothetical protein
MTLENAILYIIIIWPIGLVFLYYLFGKWLGPSSEQKDETNPALKDLNK